MEIIQSQLVKRALVLTNSTMQIIDQYTSTFKIDGDQTEPDEPPEPVKQTAVNITFISLDSLALMVIVFFIYLTKKGSDQFRPFILLACSIAITYRIVLLIILQDNGDLLHESPNMSYYLYFELPYHIFNFVALLILLQWIQAYAQIKVVDLVETERESAVNISCTMRFLTQKGHSMVLFCCILWATLLSIYTFLACYSITRQNLLSIPRIIVSVLMIIFELCITVLFPITFIALYRALKQTLLDFQFRQVKLRLISYFFIMSSLMSVRFLFYFVDKVKDYILATEGKVTPMPTLWTSYASELLFTTFILFHVYTSTKFRNRTPNTPSTDVIFSEPETNGSIKDNNVGQPGVQSVTTASVIERASQYEVKTFVPDSDNANNQSQRFANNQDYQTMQFATQGQDEEEPRERAGSEHETVCESMGDSPLVNGFQFNQNTTYDRKMKQNISDRIMQGPVMSPKSLDKSNNLYSQPDSFQMNGHFMMNTNNQNANQQSSPYSKIKLGSISGVASYQNNSSGNGTKQAGYPNRNSSDSSSDSGPQMRAKPNELRNSIPESPDNELTRSLIKLEDADKEYEFTMSEGIQKPDSGNNFML